MARGRPNSEMDLRIVTDAVPAQIGYHDRETRYRFVSAEYARFFGVPREQILGKTLREWVGERAFERLRPWVERALAGERVTFEDREPDKHGPGLDGWTRETYVPRLAPDGSVEGYFALVLDVTEQIRAEAAMRAGEERLRAATSAARIATFQIDIATGAVEFDANVLTVLYGMESVGPDQGTQHWEQLLQAWLWPDDAKRQTELLQATMRGEGDLRNELLMQNPSTGAPTWIEAQATLVRDAAGGPGRVFGILRNVTERKLAEEQRAAEHERLAVAEAVAAERQALLRRTVRAQEEERARVARDVHDGVTQLAHAAALRLDVLVEEVGARLSPAELADLEHARDLTRRAAGDGRRLIAGLRPETLDELGLAGALEQEAEALQADGWPIAFDHAGLLGVRFDPEAEITLYRVAQEALTNVRRHAGLAPVRVTLSRCDGLVRLEVRDRGRGFDVRAARAAGGEHVGLTGMRERMALVGGRLEVRSVPGDGTTVRAWAPVVG